VSAGRVLFIPVYWWHSIQNLESISLTSVYFWNQSWKGTWRDFVPKQIPPAGMRFDYVRNVINQRILGRIRGRNQVMKPS
jgi:dTDP-4-dehydrorhamnose 3,5-epimerase-like enzyme